jgi:hypothetical protein
MKKTTSIIGRDSGGNIAVQFDYNRYQWQVVYISALIDAPVLPIRGQVFRTITETEKYIESLGLVPYRQRQMNLHPSQATPRVRAAKYAQSRKAYKNKRLSVWLTPDDFATLATVQGRLFKGKKISKDNQEETIRFCLRAVRDLVQKTKNPAQPAC